MTYLVISARITEFVMICPCFQYIFSTSLFTEYVMGFGLFLLFFSNWDPSHILLIPAANRAALFSCHSSNNSRKVPSNHTSLSTRLSHSGVSYLSEVALVFFETKAPLGTLVFFSVAAFCLRSSSVSLLT